MKTIKYSFLTVFYLLLLAACSQPTPPTPQPPPTAVSSTDSAVETPTGIIELVPPTESPSAPPPPSPATEPPPPSTEPPPPPPTEPPPPPAPQVLTIFEPARDTQVMSGSTVELVGVVDPTTAVTVSVQLQAGPHLLTDISVDVAPDTGSWTTQIPIPHTVDGLAELRAATLSETAVQNLQIAHDSAADASGISLALTRPGDGQFAIAGHPLFFAGSVTGAVDETLNIGLYTDNCTTIAAHQSFTLTAADADWNGMVILPEGLNGRSCAFVYTGNPELGEWREVQLWLPAFQSDDETVVGQLMLGNTANQPYRAGRPTTFFGSAVGVPGAELLLTWLSEDGETVLAEGTAVVDVLGYWEAELLPPAETSGISTLIIQLGEGEDATILEQALLIES